MFTRSYKSGLVEHKFETKLICRPKTWILAELEQFSPQNQKFNKLVGKWYYQQQKSDQTSTKHGW